MEANLQRSQNRLFWRAMGTSGHACQVYQTESDLAEALSSYVGAGLWAGEAAVVVASHVHLDRLDAMLRQSGLDLAHFRHDDRYIALSAENTLQQLLVMDWPDRERFEDVMGGVIERAGRGGRPVRAYGEMVALLWSKGHYAAAVRLEQLWNELLEREPFRLMCAYSRDSFVRADDASIEAVRAAHDLFVI